MEASQIDMDWPCRHGKGLTRVSPEDAVVQTRPRASVAQPSVMGIRLGSLDAETRRTT
jgi:hypothetical protein